MEAYIISLWQTYVGSYGYIILFFWSILEGEMGLLFAGIAAHTGDLHLYYCIIVAALGAFSGDQIYFYIGRFNKPYIQKKFHSQRRKLALAQLMLQRYGVLIIFVQRYMYGMRTIIPISIGITRYSALKFAVINLISAFIWASVTIVPAYYLGSYILDLLKMFKHHLVLLAILVSVGGIAFVWYMNKRSKKAAKNIDKKIAKLTLKEGNKQKES